MNLRRRAARALFTLADRLDPSKSDDYETGYREGAASASEDVKTWQAEALREAAERIPHHPEAASWLRLRADWIERGEA